MIYHIILTQHPSGKFILDIVFQKKIEESLLFAGLMSAMKIFSKEIISGKANGFEEIVFRDMIIKDVPIKELGIDIFIVFDEEHKPFINEIGARLRNIIYEYKSLLIEWDGSNLSQFHLLEEPIINEIRSSIFVKSIE